MKTIKITNGEVIIKEFCTRKLRKQINKELYSSVQIKGGGENGGSSFDGFSMESLDRANDIALLGMVEKILIDDKEVPVTIETFDEMNSNDIDMLIEEVNKITSKKLPNA